MPSPPGSPRGEDILSDNGESLHGSEDGYEEELLEAYESLILGEMTEMGAAQLPEPPIDTDRDLMTGGIDVASKPAGEAGAAAKRADTEQPGTSAGNDLGGVALVDQGSNFVKLWK